MEKPYVFGLDMGGTNSVLGVVDARGHVLGGTSSDFRAEAAQICFRCIP